MNRLLLIFSLFWVTAKPVLATDELPRTIRIATWNVEWFFDDFKADNRNDLAKEQSAPSRAEWEWKLNKVAEVIAKLEPDILALQEVENREVLYRLTKVLEEKFQKKYKHCLIDGFDFGTEQEVAILYKSGLVEYSRKEQTQEMYESKNYYNLSKHLLARFEWGTGDEKQKLTIQNLHLRAAAEQEEIRQRQCKLAHEFVKDELLRGENVIILGDFNSEHSADDNNPQTDLGIARGLASSDPLDDLEDLNRFLPKEIRQTHLVGKEFDHLLASKAVMEDDPNRLDLVFSRIVTRKDLVVVGTPDQDHFNVFYSIPQAERDVSDHYPVMIELLIK